MNTMSLKNNFFISRKETISHKVTRDVTNLKLSLSLPFKISKKTLIRINMVPYPKKKIS